MKSSKGLNIKYYSFCIVSIGLAYLLIKSTKLNKFIRSSFNWLNRRNTLIVSSDHESNVAVNELRRKLQMCDTKILGFDCEWITTTKRRPVALLQLATQDGFCSIFRLVTLKRVPVDLMVLLEDKNVIKVGVAIITDAQYLLNDYGVKCEGCLDLRYLAVQAGIEARGLGSLGKELLGVDLDKDWRIRCSNWESEVLSTTQVQYAAEDACIAVNIFDVLNHKEICKRFTFWERLLWSKKDYWNNSVLLWSKFIGRNFKGNSKYNDGGPSLPRQAKAGEPVIKKDYNTLIQRRHYSNTFLLAPDGQVLSTISDSKAAWYLEKQLADLVCEDPKKVKLKFEPSRRPNEPDGYYTKPKDNRCVVCGSERDLRRKNVVPSEYRRYFDEALKNHHYHDVLLLCLPCHVRSNMFDQQLREQLVHECDAPLSEGKNNKFRELHDLKALRNAARALYRSGDVIPEERKLKLQTLICDKLGVSTQLLTQQYLENISNIDCYVESEQYVPHGQKVVQTYIAQGGVEVLECRWRQHFVDTMSPQYLPQLWSINFVRD